MSQNKCPLCAFDLLSAPREGDNWMTYFECPHCGNYKIERDALDDWPFYSKKKSELGNILSHLTRRVQSTTGTKWALINSEKIQKIIETGSLPTPQEQAEYLLHWLGTNLTGLGELIKITWKTHGAIIGAKSSNGFEFIVSGLMSEGLIPEREVKNGEAHVTLTFKGWHKFEEFQRGTTTGRRLGGWDFVLTKGLPYVVIWAAVGIGLWFAPLAVPGWLALPGSRILSDRWGELLGAYCFAVAGSSLLINPSLMGIRKLFGLASDEDVKPVYLWPPLLVGSCEAILYPTALLIGKAEFIGVWLALKVAGHWSLWTGDYKGRNRFNMFLIGNALSIITAFVFARIIQTMLHDAMSGVTLPLPP